MPELAEPARALRRLVPVGLGESLRLRGRLVRRELGPEERVVLRALEVEALPVVARVLAKD
jgi:hypothetical protein